MVGEAELGVGHGRVCCWLDGHVFEPVGPVWPVGLGDAAGAHGSDLQAKQERVSTIYKYNRSLEVDKDG